MSCTPAAHEAAKRIAETAYLTQRRPTQEDFGFNECAQGLFDTAQLWPALPNPSPGDSGRRLVTGQCPHCCSTLAISVGGPRHDLQALQLEVQALRGVVSRLLGNLPFGFDPCVYNECGDLLIYGIKAPASEVG